MYKKMCTVQSSCLSLCLSLSWVLLSLSLCCINVQWVCITLSYHYDGILFLWMFFSFVFHKALLKTKCSQFIKRRNKTQKSNSLGVACVMCECEIFTCRSESKSAPQTLGVHGEASASLGVSSWDDPAVLVCRTGTNRETWTIREFVRFGIYCISWCEWYI